MSGVVESDCRLLPAVLLCFFLGFLGVHRFYVGKGGTGALYVLLFIVCLGIQVAWVVLGIWWLMLGREQNETAGGTK